jgi:hypothetical protein
MSDDRSFYVRADDGERRISEGDYPEPIAREIYALLVAADLAEPAGDKIRIVLYGTRHRGSVRPRLSEYTRGMEDS